MSDETKIHEALREHGLLRPEYDMHLSGLGTIYLNKLLAVAEAAESDELESLRSDLQDSEEECEDLKGEIRDLERQYKDARVELDNALSERPAAAVSS